MLYCFTSGAVANFTEYRSVPVVEIKVPLEVKLPILESVFRTAKFPASGPLKVKVLIASPMLSVTVISPYVDPEDTF